MGANDGKWIFSNETSYKTVSSAILSHPTHHLYIIFDSSRNFLKKIIITKIFENLQLDGRLKYEIKESGFISREKATKCHIRRFPSSENIQATTSIECDRSQSSTSAAIVHCIFFSAYIHPYLTTSFTRNLIFSYHLCRTQTQSAYKICLLCRIQRETFLMKMSKQR